jgi:hypothetical protein
MKWAGTWVVAAVLLTVPSAHANWNIGKLVNNSGQPVTVSVPFDPGTTDSASSKLTNPINLSVNVLSTGAVVFTNQGHNTNCGAPYWGVKIVYGTQTWGFFYDGFGLVNMTVNADGSVAFSGGSNPSQVVVGSGPPKCQ